MIIGINTGHDASFALIGQDGDVRYILEEERFNREKHSSFSTHLSLDCLIQRGDLDPSEVTDLAFGFEMAATDIKDLMEKCRINVINDFGAEILQKVDAYSNQPFSFSLSAGFGTSIDMYEEIERLKQLFPNAGLSSFNHHHCHAASAYFPSPFDRSAILVLDGSGRLETMSIWHAQGTSIRLLKQIELPHSIGIFYWLFSSYINLEEGKTMGLAAYGRPRFTHLIYEKILDVRENGDFKFKIPLIFWFDMDSEFAIAQIEEIFGEKRRFDQESPIKQFHADVAASVQKVTEDVLLKLAKQAKQLTGEDNLCLAGGVIQNCVANGKLVASGIFKKTWIQAMANDCGVALGAGLLNLYQGKSICAKSWKMDHAYLGVGYDDMEIKNILDRIGMASAKVSDPSQYAAEAIADYKTVARFYGRAEVGPRALGNRSLLCDARSKLNHFTLNHIKQRESWRPLAPSVLIEKTTDFFEGNWESPFMIQSFEVKTDSRSIVPAAVHVDGSARLQTVSEKNGAYQELLRRYYAITNVPLFLNSSFNLKSEPIVQHPLEAIRVALLSGIDVLLLHNFILNDFNIEASLQAALAQNKYSALYYEYFKQAGEICLFEISPRWRPNIIRILDWLSIPYKCIGLDMLTPEVIAGNMPHIVIDNPFLFQKATKGISIPPCHIYVLENSGFMSKQRFDDFCRIVNATSEYLNSLFESRNIVVFSAAADSARITDQLMACGHQVCAKIHNITDFIAYRPNVEDDFIVLTREYIDKNNTKVREFGFLNGRGYMIWE